MKGKLLKMRGLKLFVSIALTIMTMLTLAIPAFAEGPANNNADTPQTVSVPVILDGVLYQPDEFNVIHAELHSKGIYLISMINPKDQAFYCFTSTERYNEYAKTQDLPVITHPPMGERVGKVIKDTDGNVTILAPDSANSYSTGSSESALDTPSTRTCLSCPSPISGYAQNYEHISCGGDLLTVQYNASVPSLVPYNWNDKISSAIGLDTALDWVEILYEHINYGGDQFLVYETITISNLGNYGWNDRASSIIVNFIV
ncbi:MAG: hypothetical protein WC749_04760 [Dehalococcoidia bacterium]